MIKGGSMKKSILGQSQPSFFDVEEKRMLLEDLGKRHERYPCKLSEVARESKEYFLWLKEQQRKAEVDGASPYTPEALQRLMDEFIQSRNAEFELHSYMLSLYNDEVRKNGHWPGVCRSDLEPIKVGSELENRVTFLKTGEHCTTNHINFVNAKPQHLREFSGRFMDVFRSLHVGNGFRHGSNHINFLKEYAGTHYQDNAFVLDTPEEKQFVEAVKSVKYVGMKKLPRIPHNAENWFFTNGWSHSHPTFILEFSDDKWPSMIAYLSNGIHGQAYEEGELLVAML
jgi:hypothetical protein